MERLVRNNALAGPAYGQTVRWVFTLNNYDNEFDYSEHLKLPEFRVKRAVLGFERGHRNRTPHLQGYVEFERSMRLFNVRTVLERARWENATGTTQQNVRYCVKEGKFEILGDFSKELFPTRTAAAAANSNYATMNQVIAGLLDPNAAPRVRISKEYSEKQVFYEKASNIMSNLKIRNEMYDEWRTFRLRIWQRNVMRMLMGQNSREILWVVDKKGDAGKTFLAYFLTILYGFQMLDGMISARDLGPMLERNIKGIVFDVCRSNHRFFDYGTLETLKNRYLVSSKYSGQTIWLPEIPVIVFANHHPNREYLSEDRWNIIVLKDYDYDDAENRPYCTRDKAAVWISEEEFPYVRPPPVPPLTAQAGTLKDYLDDLFPHLSSNGECIFCVI